MSVWNFRRVRPMVEKTSIKMRRMVESLRTVVYLNS